MFDREFVGGWSSILVFFLRRTYSMSHTWRRKASDAGRPKRGHARVSIGSKVVSGEQRKLPFFGTSAGPAEVAICDSTAIVCSCVCVRTRFLFGSFFRVCKAAC